MIVLILKNVAGFILTLNKNMCFQHMWTQISLALPEGAAAPGGGGVYCSNILKTDSLSQNVENTNPSTVIKSSTIIVFKGPSFKKRRKFPIRRSLCGPLLLRTCESCL
jgi:hypothetical protein